MRPILTAVFSVALVVLLFVVVWISLSIGFKIWLRSLGMSMQTLMMDPVFQTFERGNVVGDHEMSLQLCARVHRMHAQRTLLQIPDGLRLIGFLWMNQRRCAAVVRDCRRPKCVHVAFRCGVHFDEMSIYLFGSGTAEVRLTVSTDEEKLELHKGIWGKFVHSMNSQLASMIDPGDNVNLTGYSIGGTWATMAAVSLLLRDHEGDISLVTFASPPVVSKKTAQILERVIDISNYINDNDWITMHRFRNFVQLHPTFIISNNKSMGKSAHTYSSYLAALYS